jgi:hypothetical protein
LCKVSKNELDYFFNPRIFSLHKLVEVAEFNIFRIQIEWAKIWSLISDHLVYVATNYNHDNICNDAIDSLRQIVTKLLQKSDLAVYNFQIDFFKPFEAIFTQSVNRSDRSELILTCIFYIVQNSKNIHSGWIVIFEILKNGLKRKDQKINSEIVKILQTINDEFTNFTNINAEVFRGYIECLCHMYLQDNLKKLAFDNILKLMYKIFSLQNNKDKKFEYLKIFFYGLDDLLRLNVVEHLNLLFEVINYNREIIFSSDIFGFIQLYYSYFKPHIVSLCLFNYIQRLSTNYFTESTLEKIYEDSVYNDFSSKTSTEDMYQNIKIYLEYSLNKFIEKEEQSIKTENNNSNFLELSKNGGSESKTVILNFLKNISKSYDIDSGLIIKKIDILKSIEKKEFENALELFMEKFYNMISKVSDSYMNYKYFYEDLLTTNLRLATFNKYSDLIFKVVGKNLLACGTFVSDKCWNDLKEEIYFMLNIMANIKDKYYSQQCLEDLIQFLYNLSLFYYSEIVNHFEFCFIEEEYKLINKIYIKILDIELNTEIEEYKPIEQYTTIEILKNFSKIKYLILEKEKNNDNNISKYYDENNIILLEKLERIFEKYNMAEDDNSELIDTIDFELKQIIPKFLQDLDEENLKKLFTIVMNFVDSKNSQLRYSAKYILKNYVTNGYIQFVKK